MKTYKNISISVVLIAIVAVFSLVGCEKDFTEEDSDLIAGKWRNTSILSLDSVKVTDLMAYSEFAPYNFVYDKRTQKNVTFEYDSTQEKPYLRTTRTGHYTLKGDSLIIKDYKLHTKNYIVLYVRNDTLCYRDESNNKYTFVRYYGEEEQGKEIQDVYYKK